MKDKKLYFYLLLVIAIASVAFVMDLYSSSVPVELGTKTILDNTGKPTTTLEVDFPLWQKFSNLLINFLYGLAAAVFITVFVANRLQKAQQDEKEEELKKLNNAINVNVFDSLFKTIIPEEIFKIIKQEIIESNIVRKEAKWIYDFTLDEATGEIECRMTTRYELHNLSQKDAVDPIKLELDTLGGNEYKIEEAECRDVSDKVLVHFDPKDKGNNKNVVVNENGSHTTVEYSVKIPPESHVVYKTVFIRRYEGNIVDSQATKVPVIGADVIVNFPKDYCFDISPTMSTKPKLISKSDMQKIYRVNGGILPWQGFTFYLVEPAANKSIQPTAEASAD
ncbi:hypothetical protein ACFOEK_19200 [Litoribrevibacter euphylliae]|uniref:Uncharacterized protein n=1 Tax=Litoribrevibacter euphylliae TaxID=1834034 RepID=A0ABV7HKB5_9GAMM